MQCCMPLCENKSENFSKCGRITFHGFPSEPGLRTAWLRALGTQDSQLLNSAVVCSQHFLHDDICETESGSRQLRTGAVPSTVLVCMTCLDTDSKMSLISQYNLEEAYEKLTGHPLWDGGNLKQTLCVQCAQQLRNFSRFREQSLRARSLMLELLEEHEVITLQHIKIIQQANNKLKNNLVSTKLRPELCDMYIPRNSDDRQTGSPETVHGVTVKTECSEDSQWESADTQMIIEENADCVKVEFTIDQLTYEGAVFTCSVCCEQFPHEHAYSAHARTHLHDARPAAASAHTAETPWSARLATNTGNEARAAESADTTQHSERALVTNSGASDSRAPDSDHTTNTELKSCVVKLYDILNYPQNAKIKVESSPPSLQTASSRDSLYAHTAREDVQHRAPSEDEVAATHKEPAASVLSGTEPGTRTFTCNVCERAFTRKGHLVSHMNSHTCEKPYSCEICGHKFAYKSHLVPHMRTHTGEKPYSCKICSYKCIRKGDLVTHVRTHTGEKLYSCEICNHKFADKSNLVSHMRTHTGEKPYSCKICSYKCIRKGNLVTHVKTHTGEKPYSCEICNHKFAYNSNLVRHMRTHSGEKPYSCDTCSYKYARKASLLKHLRTHTGEKRYSCEICNHKFADKSYLVSHMRTHTGEKPYSCKICSYKCIRKGDLVTHVRTHTGEKPYSCKICSCKFSQKSNLVKHMRSHTGAR